MTKLVTLAQLKAHSRVDFCEDDALLDELIDMATRTLDETYADLKRDGLVN